MQPKVTIFMSHYNDGQYLPECIEGILNQTFQDWEFIIADDGSTDKESLEILRNYEKVDNRLRVFYYKKNRGPDVCSAESIKKARAPYLHPTGADDVRYPNLLQENMDMLLKHPELGMSWGQVDWGKEGDIQREFFGFDELKETIYMEPEESQKRLLTQELKVSSASGVFRSDLFNKYGCFDQKLNWLSDWYLLHLILLNHPVAFIPKPLAFFRVREDSANYSNVRRHDKQIKKATYKYLLEKLNQEPLHREQFRKTALLTPMFHDLFWKLLFNPRYIHYWPYIAKKYPVGKRIRRSLLKKIGVTSGA